MLNVIVTIIVWELVKYFGRLIKGIIDSDKVEW